MFSFTDYYIDQEERSVAFFKPQPNPKGQSGIENKSKYGANRTVCKVQS
jgi:hypothetical protein